jgi:clan AA aspartic protease (TIGR02281 family)
LPSASRIRGRLAHGGVLLIPVRVQGQDFEFLLDTGAAYTALSEDIITLLGITVNPQRMAAIAPAHGGVFQVPMVTIKELRLGGFRLTDIAAIVLEFPPILKIDGVLGMNILRQFRMTLEADTATLVLRRLTFVA